MQKGIKSLKAAVLKDCEKGEDCFNQTGCDKSPGKAGKCFHRYCDKFFWVMGRAKHYAEKTGIDYLIVLEKWETARDYWYMNYYQDSNQPLLTGENVLMLDEWLSQLEKRFGKDKKNWKFICPICKHVQSVEDFIKIGVDGENAYFNCIGRFQDGIGCDWTLGGLLKLHTTTVINDLRAIPVFEMAPEQTG